MGDRWRSRSAASGHRRVGRAPAPWAAWAAWAAATLLLGCGAGADEESRAIATDEVASGEAARFEGRVVVGSAMSDNHVPVVRHGEEAPRVWVFDAATAEVEELPSPTTDWILDPSVAATSEWLVLSAATCPEPPVDDDLGLVCGTDAPDAVFIYGFGSREWTMVESPRVPTAGIGQVVSIVGSDARLSYRRTYEDSSVTYSVVDLAAEAPEVRPSGDSARHQCATSQPPAVMFDDPGFRTARVGAVGSREARTVELPDEATPLANTAGAPRPSCSSAGDFMLLPAGSAPEQDGFDFSIHRLDAQPVRIATGHGVVVDLVAGAEWVAATDGAVTTVWDRDGNEVRRIERAQVEVPVATDAGIVFSGSDGGATTLQVEPVR